MPLRCLSATILSRLVPGCATSFFKKSGYASGYDQPVSTDFGGYESGYEDMLTDTKCRNAKPKEKPYRLADTNGLFLEVKPNGVKAWRFRFKLTTNGETKESIFAIGDYAVAPSGETKEEALACRAGRQLTLAEAREERLRARALVKQGVNPAHHRQQEKMKRQLEAADTFEVVTSEWLALRQWEHVCWRRHVFDPGADFGLTHPEGLPSHTQQQIYGIALGHGKSAPWVNLASALTPRVQAVLL